MLECINCGDGKTKISVNGVNGCGRDTGTTKGSEDMLTQGFSPLPLDGMGATH